MLEQSYNTLFILLRAALGSKNVGVLPHDINWEEVIDLSFEHGVAAIAVDGLQKVIELYPDQELSIDREEDLEGLKYEWFGCVFDTESQNTLISLRTRDLTDIFSSNGYRSCVLKGQGNALFYPFPEHRLSGDIDLWVEGKRRSILQFVEQIGIKVGHVDVKHSDVIFFSDVQVEIHFYPSYSYNPFVGQKLSKWTNAQSRIQFSLFDSTVGFTHPSIDFNLVYCLLHLYRHLFSEGVGIRQVVDYYCILKHSNKAQRQKAFDTICSFRMKRFTEGLMWVLCEIFLMNDSMLLCSKNESEGRFLLKEFMRGAGFGRNDERNSDIKKTGYFIRGIFQFKKNLRFLKHYPQEVLWSPFWKLWHWCWRKAKGYL